MKIKKLLLSAAVIFGLTSFGSVANAACGNISIANMNWASANFMAEVDKIILEEGYGSVSYTHLTLPTNREV